MYTKSKAAKFYYIVCDSVCFAGQYNTEDQFLNIYSFSMLRQWVAMVCLAPTVPPAVVQSEDSPKHASDSEISMPPGRLTSGEDSAALGDTNKKSSQQLHVEKSDVLTQPTLRYCVRVLDQTALGNYTRKA